MILRSGPTTITVGCDHRDLPDMCETRKGGDYYRCPACGIVASGQIIRAYIESTAAPLPFSPGMAPA